MSSCKSASLFRSLVRLGLEADGECSDVMLPRSEQLRSLSAHLPLVTSSIPLGEIKERGSFPSGSKGFSRVVFKYNRRHKQPL